MDKQILRKWWVILIFLGAIIFVLSLDTSSEEETPSTSSIEDIDKLMEKLEKLRELKFKNKVKTSIKTRAELKRKLINEFKKNITEEEFDQIKKTLVKFGLVPKELNLKKLLIDIFTEQIAGYYDSKTKELCLINPDENEKPPVGFDQIERQFGVPWQNMVIIHELMHALQDQQFDLESLPRDEKNNDDLVAALVALIDGEATFIQYDYLLRNVGQDLTLLPDVSRMGETPPATGMSIMDAAPKYIREGLLFPYTKGFVFIWTVKREKGWEEINKMYQTPPLSTEQILHPQKYLSETPDYPTLIKLPDFSKVFPEDWKELRRNVMGEFSILIMLNEFLPNINVKKIASGWDGDQYVILEHKKTEEEIILIWLTTWDALRDAQQFFEAYSQLITQKYKEAKVLQQEENKIIWTDAEKLILLELKDKDVLVIESIPEKILPSLIEIIWKETNREELREIKRVVRNNQPLTKKAQTDEPQPEEKEDPSKKEIEKRAKIEKAKAQIEEFKLALAMYELDNGRYPTTKQGLEALRTEPFDPPEPRNWRGPYLKKDIPKDPWGNPYKYRCPGKHNPRGYDLSSLGPDGIEGTEDDIVSWAIEKK